MPIAAKPYTVTWPFAANAATEMDQMFDLLFTQLRVSAIGEGQAATLVFPTFTKGSIFHISDTIGTVAGLALGGAGTMLRSDAALPNWSVTTWPNSAVTGDILFASGTNAYGNLAGVTTGNALLSGGVGVAPVWGDLDLTTTVTGILPVLNGGTGLNTITLGRIIIGNGTGVPTLLSPGTVGVMLRGNSSTAWNVTTWTIVNAFPQGSIPFASTQDVLQALLVGAAGTVLVGGATIPSYTATPTITTSLTTPLIIGGTAVGSTLTLKSTTGVGVNDAIIGLIGNNGNAEVMRLNSTNAKFTSVFLDNAFGTHSFNAGGTGGNILSVTNTIAGTGNSASITVGTDTIINFIIQGFSSTYTPSGYAFANGGAIANSGDGGLSFAQTGAGDIRFYTTGSQLLRMTIATGGAVSVVGALRVAGAVTGFLGVKTGTAFNQGFQISSAANDSMLETTYDGTRFLIDSTYQTSEGYKDVVFRTTGSDRLTIAAGGTITAAFGFAIGLKLLSYNAVTTTGWGIPAIYGTGRSTAQTAAVASVATYTVGAADGSFLISANVQVTTSTLHNFTVTVAYTDETNTARVQTLPLVQLAGTPLTAITNATGVGPYESMPIHIRCKAATAITIATTGIGGFTTVTYNVEGAITQIA